MTALLQLQDVHAAYGLSRVLFGISLEVNQGECVCLLGRNGVGKTTTMRTVMGLTPPNTGHVRFKSGDITGWAPYRVARAGIGFVPEDRRVFAELSVWENLDVARRAAARPGHWTIESVIELFPVLGALRDRQSGFLSGGEQQMLTIARTLMGNPELLLLDEPSEGLAPLVVQALLAKIGAQGAGADDPAGGAGDRVLPGARRPRLRAGEGGRAFCRTFRRPEVRPRAARPAAGALR